MTRPRPTLVDSLATVAEPQLAAVTVPAARPATDPGSEVGPRVLTLNEDEYQLSLDALLADRWVVHVVDGAHITTAEAACAALRRCLGLPATVNNLDALEDALRDLPDLTDAQRTALIWHQPEVVAEQAPHTWAHIVEIIAEAATPLWAGIYGSPRALELAVCPTPVDLDSEPDDATAHPQS